MTTLQNLRRIRRPVAALSLAALMGSQMYLSAADVYLIRRGDGIGSIFSYAEKALPTAADTIVAGSLMNGDLTLNGLFPGYGSQSIGGIKILNNAGGNLVLQANASGVASQVLNLGAAGIDMSASNRNLTINKTNTQTLGLNIAAAQSWLVGPGRTLTVGSDVTGSNALTLQTVPLGATPATGAVAMNGVINLAAPLNVIQGGTGAFTFGVAGTAPASVTASAINVTATATGGITFNGPVTTAGALNLDLRSGGGVTFGGTVAAGSVAVNTLGSGGATINGIISGATTTLNFNNASNAVSTLQGNNDFLGATTVTGGQLNLKYDVAAAPVAPGSYPGSNFSKLSDTAALTLERATLNLTTLAASGHDEVVGSLSVGSGLSRIQRSAASGRLMANAITRQAGGVLDFAADGIATTDNTSGNGATVNGILGGWATTVSGADWATNSTNTTDGSIASLNAVGVTPAVNTWTNPAANIFSNVALTGTTPAGVTTINSLRLTAVAQTLNQTAASTLVIGSGGIIVAGNFARTIGTLGASITAGDATTAAAARAGATNNELFFHIGAGTTTVNATIADNTAGSLPGTGMIGLVKSQGGTLVLGGFNTYTGKTVIAGGTLQIGAGATSGTIGNGNIENFGTLIFNRTDNITLNQNISGSGGLTWNQGTSTVTLGGNNTYRGTTTVTRGLLSVGAASGVSRDSQISLSNDATAQFRLNGLAVEAAMLFTPVGQTGGSTNLGSGGSLTVGASGASGTYSGLFSGSGALVKKGAGTWTLVANALSSVAASISVEGGTMTVPGNNTLLTSLTTAAGTSLTMANNNTFSQAASISGTATMSGNNTFNSSFNVGPGGTLTMGGNNNFNGPVTYNSASTLTLGASTVNVFGAAAPFTIDAGNVIFQGTATLPALTVNGGTATISRAGGVVGDNAPIVMGGPGAALVLNESEAAGSLAGLYGSQVTIAATRSLQVGGDGTSTAFDGVIAGAGGVTKSGAGNWTLGGGNTFTGALIINGGSVSLATNTPLLVRPDMIPDRAAVTLGAGTSLNLQGRTEFMGSLTGAGDVSLGQGGHIGFGVLNTNTTLSGVISGTDAQVTKRGSGSTTLTGTNSFTGTLKIDRGRVILDSATGTALADTTAVVLNQAGAVLEIGTAGESIGNFNGAAGSALVLNGNLATTIIDGAQVIRAGVGGRTILNSNNTTSTTDSPDWTGNHPDDAIALSVGMRLINPDLFGSPTWVVQLSGSNKVLMSNVSQGSGEIPELRFAPVALMKSNTSGVGGWTKNGSGTLILAGNQTHTGDTVINGGTVQLGGFESGGRFVNQNVLSDASQLVLGTSGVQIVNFAGSGSNLFTFERIGSLAGGGGANSSVNLVEASAGSPLTPRSANVGTLALGGDNKSSIFTGNIAGKSADRLVWLIKEGTGVFDYVSSSSSNFEGVARIEDGTLRIPSGDGLNEVTALFISNRPGATFETMTSQSTSNLSGGAGTRGFTRTGIIGASMGNLLVPGGETGGQVKLSGISAVLTVNDAEAINTAGSNPIYRLDFSGVISGSGSLSKLGGIPLVLSGANTYTGLTNISGGSVQLGYLSKSEGVGVAAAMERRGSLSPSTSVDLTNLSRFVTNGLDTQITSLNSFGTNYTEIGAGTLTLSNATGNYQGPISSGGGISNTGSTVRGAGLLNITGGTLTLISIGAIDGPQVRVAGASLVVDDNENKLANDTWLELATGGSLAFGPSNSLGEVIGSITGAGSVSLGAGRTLTLTQAGGTSRGDFTGVISGTGSSSGLTLAGGSLILSATQDYLGATTVRSGAELVLNTGSGVGTSAILPDAGTVVLEGGVIRLTGDKTEVLGAVTLGAGVSHLTKGLVASGKIDIGTPTMGTGAALLVESGTVLTDLSNNVSNGILGGFAVLTDGTWAVRDSLTREIKGLAASSLVGTKGINNHYLVSVSETVTNPTVSTLNVGNLANPATITLTGDLLVNAGGILVKESGANSLTITGSPSAPIGQDPQLVSGSDKLFIHQFNRLAPLTLDVPIVDNVGPTTLVKTGQGTLILTQNDNSYAGEVVIGAGTVQVGNNGSTGSLGSNATAVTNNGVINYARTGGGSTINPAIAGSGSIRQIGTNQLTLDSNSSTFSGRLSIQSGTVLANSLGSAAGGTSVESGGSLIFGGSTSLEAIGLKGGSLGSTGAIFAGPITIIRETSAIVSRSNNPSIIRGMVTSALFPDTSTAVTFSRSGGQTVRLERPTGLGGVAVTNGARLELGFLTDGQDGSTSVNAFIPRQSPIVLNSASPSAPSAVVLSFTQPHRFFANTISGVGDLRFQPEQLLLNGGNTQVWLTGANTYSGTTYVGGNSATANVGAPNRQRATLHVGADSFTGSVGTGPVVVTSLTSGASQIRTHRYDTLQINGVTLNPARVDGAIRTAAVNADFVREGMGNVVLTGQIKSGPLAEQGLFDTGSAFNAVTNPLVSGHERALFTANGGGRLIFNNAVLNSTTNSWANAETTGGPIAINNNGYVEFRATTPGHQYEIFGALGGGGIWTFDTAGTVKLSNEPLLVMNNDTGTDVRPLSTWNGNALVQRGTLETMAERQFNGGRVYLGSGGTLDLTGRQSPLTVGAASGAQIVLQSGAALNTRSGLNNANISGDGDLEIYDSLSELYFNGSSFGGITVMGNNGTARVTSLANSGSDSSIGAGNAIQFGKTTDFGTLDFIGRDDVTMNREIRTVLSDDGLSPYSSANALINSNGIGTVALSGDVKVQNREGDTQAQAAQNGQSRWFTLGGINTGNNTFSGQIDSEAGVVFGTGPYAARNIGLRKTGTGTWQLNGSRPTFTQPIQIQGGNLEYENLAALGNTAVARTIYLSGGNLVRYDNDSLPSETIPSNVTFTTTGGTNSGIINNDLNTRLIIDGDILSDDTQAAQDNGTRFSSRSLTFGGSNTSGINEVNGDIISNSTSLNKSGASHWRLSGRLFFGGNTVISGGTLEVAGTVPIFGSTNLTDFGTVTLNNADGIFNSGTNSYSRLMVTTNDAIGALNGNVGSRVDIASGQTLTMQLASGTFAGLITGGGGLKVTTAINGSGRVATFSNKNTYTGVTSIVSDVGGNVGGNRIDVYHLANGGAVSGSGIGSSTNAAANLVISTKTGSGGLRFIGFTPQSTDRLFTMGAGSGGSGEGSASIWADGQNAGKNVATISFTNPGAIAFEGAGDRRLILQGGNRGTLLPIFDSGSFTYTQSFNEFSPILGDNGGATSIRKAGDSVWLLNGANTFTGEVTIERGTLSISHNTALGSSALGTPADGVVVAQNANDTRAFLDLRNVAVAGEVLQLNSVGSNNSAVGWGASKGTNSWSGPVANNVASKWAVLNDPVTNTATTLTVSGVVSGGSAITFVGNGKLTLSGSNIFAGQFTASGAALDLDYTTNNTSKLPDAVALILGGSGNQGVQGSNLRGGTNAATQRGVNLRLVGGSHVEKVDGLTINAGASYISRSGGTSTIEVKALTRGAVTGGTLDVQSGVVNTTTVFANNHHYLTVGKSDFATLSSGNIVALTSYASVASSGANYDVQSAAAIGGTVNTLRFNGATPITLPVGDLILEGSGILITPAVGANKITINGSSLTSGTGLREIIFHQHNVDEIVEVGVPIINNGTNTVGITKSGLGTVVLLGANTNTARTVVNEGLLLVGGNAHPTASLGNGGITVTSKIKFDLAGATELPLGGLAGDGVFEMAETNTRTLILSGNNGGFNGIINVLGGTLATDANGNALGGGLARINIGFGATVDLRNTVSNGDGNLRNVNGEIYLQGTLKTTLGPSFVPSSVVNISNTSSVGGSLHVLSDQAIIDIPVAGHELRLGGMIYSTTGLTKVGAGRLNITNGNMFEAALDGTTGRNMTPTLSGQIKVTEGELWLSGGGRAAGATGFENEILVSGGATLDLRGADLAYGDDSDPERKWVILSSPVGSGVGARGTGMLRNTTGTARLAYTEVNGDVTIGLGGIFNGANLDFAPYDTSVATGATLPGLVDFSESRFINSSFSNTVTKTGTGVLTFRDTKFEGNQIAVLKIEEGEVRFERNTPPNVGTGEINSTNFGMIRLAYNTPSTLDTTLPLSALGPVTGPRLEFFKTTGVRHDASIFLDGQVSNLGGAANYLELSSDASGVPASSTFLGAPVEVSGPAFANVFNIESGQGTGSIAAQGNLTSEVQGKLVLAGGVTGLGGLSKIGSRELRITFSSPYSGETLLTRQGTINVPARNDLVTVNGVQYQTLGEAESWGEFGLTLNGAGAITASSAIKFERNALLTLDNTTRLDATSDVTTTNLNNRLNDAANLDFRGGTLRIMGGESVVNTETIAAGAAKLRSLASINNIDLWNTDGANKNITLTIGDIIRSPGSVLRFRAMDSSALFSTTTPTDKDSVRVALTTAPTLVGGASGTSRGVVTGMLGGTAPHAIYEDTRLQTDLYAQGRNLQNATGSHFMTYDGSYLRPLDDSEYYVPSDGFVEAAAAGTNVNLTDVNYFTRNSVSINTLRFGPTADHDQSGAALSTRSNLTGYTSNWQPTIYIDDSATLNVASGMISSASFGLGIDSNNTTYIRGGTIDFGTREGIINNQNYRLRLTDGIYAGNNFEIQSRMVGSGGLTKVGAQTIVLDAQSSYTGVTTVNEGILTARSGRNAFGQGGPGNGIVVQGLGDIRLTNGVIIGSAAAPKDLLVGLLTNDGQQILRADNGNNFLYGDIIYDNVDSVGHANPVARPRISVGTNQTLNIKGDIYGGATAVTGDTYYTDSRLITFEGEGYINISGQVGDRGVGGAAKAIASPITAGILPGMTNENQVFRLHMSSNQGLNLALDKQYNAAGRLALDQGILLINYEPGAPGSDGNGFWTTEAITKLAGVRTSDMPVAVTDAENGNSNSNNFLNTTDGLLRLNQGNNGTSMHGFGLGTLNIGAGNQAVFLTKPNQVFNMGTWSIGGSGGYAVLGGLNTSGTVTYGTGQGTLSLGGRSVRFYANAGGTVEALYRFNGGSFQKNGRGTMLIRQTAKSNIITTNSDTHSYELAGGTLRVDLGDTLNLLLLGRDGTFTGSGGTLHGVGSSTTAKNFEVANNGDGRQVRFLQGNTQVLAEAKGNVAFNVILGNGNSGTVLSRGEGATANFAGFNSTGGTGAGAVMLNFQTGVVLAYPKNHVMEWAAVGTSARTATDFAMVDGNNGNRVVPFFRALDEYKNDVATWAIGEDVSEDTLTGNGGSGFRGTMPNSLAINTIRFDAPANSIFSVGAGNTLQVAQSGIIVSSNTGAANKTIDGGRLASSTIQGGKLTSGSNVIINLENTAGLYVGMPMSGTGIPIGTFIQEIIDGTSVRMTNNATATTALAAQGVVFGTRELVIHQFGQGDLVISSGIGDGNATVGGLQTLGNSSTVTLANTIGVRPGMGIVGPHIPSGATVVTVVDATTVTISLPATATGSGGQVEFITPGTGPSTVANATWAASSNVISVSTSAPVVPGMIISGAGIPSGTTVTAVNTGTHQLTLSNTLPAIGSGATLYVTHPNDLFEAPTTFTGGYITSGSNAAEVGNSTNLRVGMGLVGPTGLPENAVVATIAKFISSGNLIDFTTTTLNTVTQSGQTIYGVSGVVPLTGAIVDSGNATITVASTLGLKAGMPVYLPDVPLGSKVASVFNTTQFSVTVAPNGSGTGLKGYAQHNGTMPAVLTGGSTFTATSVEDLVTVDSTAGLVAGLTIIGPNIPSGTVITSVESATELKVSKFSSAAGTGLTFLIGTQSSMPISMAAGEVVSGRAQVRVASTRGIQEGVVLIGEGIPASATVVSVDSAQQITMSVNAISSQTGITIRAVSPMALTISGPSTTGQGESGTTGAVVLANPNNTNGGKVYVNGGVLSIANESSLGIASAVGTSDQLTLNGGTLRWTGLNGQLSPTRGLTLGGNGGVIEISETTGHLFVQRSITSQDQYRGDLIKTGPGQLIFEGDSGQQANFRGLLDIREGTVRMAGDTGDLNEAGAAGTTTMFGSNLSWADGTILRNGANLMLQMGYANGSGDWNFDEFITFEGNNTLTVGTPNGATRPVNWNGPIVLSGPLTIDTVLGGGGNIPTASWSNGSSTINGGSAVAGISVGMIISGGTGLPAGAVVTSVNVGGGTFTIDTVTASAGSGSLTTALPQVFRLNNGGGFITGSGDIIKEGMGILEFRENIPDWTGGLEIKQGRVLAANQADVLGTGHLNGKKIILGSNERAGIAELFLQSDLGVSGSVWEINLPIDVVYNPAQTKRIGVQSQPQNGMDFQFNGNITLGDNLVISHVDSNGATVVGGDIVHMYLNGNITDAAGSSGNIILQNREGNGGVRDGASYFVGDANGNTNGRFYVYNRFGGNNSGWTGDLVISDNVNYNHDQTSIARMENPLAISANNEVIMNYNSILQTGGNSITIGGLQTLGGDGPFGGNVGTGSGNGFASAQQNFPRHSSELIENGGSTPATLTITQSTPAHIEVKWDAMFQDGTLASHFISPGQAAPAAALSLTKAGDGWATLSLDNNYTGTTHVAMGTLQVGVGGIGDTGASRAHDALGLTSVAGTTVAGTGSIQGAATIGGLLKPGDIAGNGIGTLNVNGNLTLGDGSLTTIQVQAAAINIPELAFVDFTAVGTGVDGIYDSLRELALGTFAAGVLTLPGSYANDLSDPVSVTQHDQIRGAGSLTLSGSATLELVLNGYAPKGGDVFRVFEFATYAAAASFDTGDVFRFGGESGHDLNLPFLGDNFVWDTSRFKDQGVLVVNQLQTTSVVPERPQITAYSRYVVAALNGPATLTGRAIGKGTINFEWKRNNLVVSTTTASSTTTYTIPLVNAASVGAYELFANNEFGSDNRIGARATELVGLDKTGSNRFVPVKGSTTLTATVVASKTGLGLVKYQWFRNGVAIADGVNPNGSGVKGSFKGTKTKSLVISAFSANEAATYYCEVGIPGGNTLAAGNHVLGLLEKPAFILNGSNTALANPLPNGAVAAPYSYDARALAIQSGAYRAPTSYRAVGLPTGVKIDAVTGLISGSPDVDLTAARVFSNIQIFAKNASGETASPKFSISIDPLPNTAVGAFAALIARDAIATGNTTFTNGKGGRVDVTTTRKGAFTLRVTNGTVVASAKGRLSNIGGAPTASVLIKRKAPLTNLTVTFTIAANNLVSGNVTNLVTTVNPTGLVSGGFTVPFSGWRNVWFKGKTPALSNLASARFPFASYNLQATFTNLADEGDLTKPQGATTSIVRVASPGNATAVARLGDGTAVASMAAPLGPNGQVLFYRALYTATQQGTLHGTTTITEGITTGDANAVTGALTWSKPGPPVRPSTAKPGKLYDAGWPSAPLALTVAGGRYFAPLAKKLPAVPVGEIVMGLPEALNNAQMIFEFGKIDAHGYNGNSGDLDIPFTVSTTSKVVIPAYNVNLFPNPNPGSLKVTINAATGEFTGSALLQNAADIDTSTGKPTKRVVAFTGLIIPDVNTTANMKDGIGVGRFILQDLPLVPAVQNAGFVTLQPAVP